MSDWDYQEETCLKSVFLNIFGESKKGDLGNIAHYILCFRNSQWILNY